MKRQQTFAIGTLVAGISLLLVARLLTSQTETSASAKTQTPLLVSAAASLQDALDAIEPLFEDAHPEIALDHNFASSGALQRQIEQGAPADVFFSAGVGQMNALADRQLLDAGTRRDVLANRLVLVVPADSSQNLKTFNDLDAKTRTNAKIAVGEFQSVPAGQYAQQVFSRLDLLDPLRSRFVFFSNVRGVLAAVESGNADAGVVYATDASISDRVQVVATAPETSHDPIVYPIAVLEASKEPTAARVYLEFLSTPPAIAVFEQFGFTVIDAED